MATKTHKKSTSRDRPAERGQGPLAPVPGAGRPPAPAVVTGPATPAAERSDAARPAAKPVDAEPPDAGPERGYADVTVLHIQQWLGRTPNLKFRRGASALLTYVTGKAIWENSLPVGVEWNTEAGEVAGVVTLRTTAEVAPDTAKAALSAAVRRVAEGIRSQIAHCSIQAVSAPGVSYAHAYEGLQARIRDGDLLLDAPAPPVETILAKPCDMCRHAPTEYQDVMVVKEALGLCGECHERFKYAGGTKDDDPEWSPQPERDMLAAVHERLEGTGNHVEGFSHDFAHMAKAGGRELDDAPTQLALIYADGNGLGVFLKLAAATALASGVPKKDEIVLAIDGATKKALAEAVVATFVLNPGATSANQERPPVLAHVAGGDDLVVSVPAADAWPFVRALLGTFGGQTAELAENWKIAEAPTMSAGMVFHHNTHPFSDVVEKAERHLKAAKQLTGGLRASVSFLDLTADGADAPAGRAHRLEDLDRDADLYGRIADLPKAGRYAITALLRQCLEHDTVAKGPAVDPEGETAAAALARRVADLGHGALWEAVVAGGGPADGTGAEAVRDALSKPGARACLRACLDVARWWPRATQSSPPFPEGIPG